MKLKLMVFQKKKKKRIPSQQGMHLPLQLEGGSRNFEVKIKTA